MLGEKVQSAAISMELKVTEIKVVEKAVIGEAFNNDKAEESLIFVKGKNKIEEKNAIIKKEESKNMTEHSADVKEYVRQETEALNKASKLKEEAVAEVREQNESNNVIRSHGRECKYKNEVETLNNPTQLKEKVQVM